MILGDFQPQWCKLHHQVVVDLHEFPVLRGKYQRRWMTEIDKAEMSVRTQLTVNHRGDFARIVIRIPSKSVPCGH